MVLPSGERRACPPAEPSVPAAPLSAGTSGLEGRYGRVQRPFSQVPGLWGNLLPWGSWFLAQKEPTSADVRCQNTLSLPLAHSAPALGRQLPASSRHLLPKLRRAPGGSSVILGIQNCSSQFLYPPWWPVDNPVLPCRLWPHLQAAVGPRGAAEACQDCCRRSTQGCMGAWGGMPALLLSPCATRGQVTFLSELAAPPASRLTRGLGLDPFGQETDSCISQRHLSPLPHSC